MELRSKKNLLEVESNSKNIISLDKETNEVKIDDLVVSYPGEYEKSGILLEVKEYEKNLFYSFSVDSKHILFVLVDNFELKEEILSFFGDVDILVIPGTKNSVKIYENIEARIVVPYGEGKSIFFQTLGKNPESVSSFKVKGEFAPDSTDFVNLEE